MDAKETLKYLYQHGHLMCGADYEKIYAELAKPITEHPDVQRLIGQVVELEAEIKRLKETCRRIEVITNMSENLDSATELQLDLKIIGRMAALKGDSDG